MNGRQYELVRLFEQADQAPTLQENGEIYCWLSFEQLGELTRIVGPDYFSDGGLNANIRSDCVCIVINELLEYMGIDEDVFASREGAHP